MKEFYTFFYIYFHDDVEYQDEREYMRKNVSTLLKQKYFEI